jgi:hypothetical protein
VGLLQSLGGVSFPIIFALTVIVTALQSHSRSTLDSIVEYKSDIQFVIAKSGILLASVGLEVGSPVDRQLRLLCCMTCNKVSSFGSG